MPSTAGSAKPKVTPSVVTKSPGAAVNGVIVMAWSTPARLIGSEKTRSGAVGESFRFPAAASVTVGAMRSTQRWRVAVPTFPARSVALTVRS